MQIGLGTSRPLWLGHVGRREGGRRGGKRGEQEVDHGKPVRN